MVRSWSAAGSTLSINAAGGVDSLAALTNDGTLNVGWGADGTLNNYGQLANNGTLNVGPWGDDALDNFGQLTDKGTLIDNGTLTNSGACR